MRTAPYCPAEAPGRTRRGPRERYHRREGAAAPADSRRVCRVARIPRHSGMLRPLAQRALAGVAVVWGVVSLVFLLLHAAPGDPAALLLGPTATAAQIAAQREGLGLDRPLAVQYIAWLA